MIEELSLDELSAVIIGLAQATIIIYTLVRVGIFRRKLTLGWIYLILMMWCNMATRVLLFAKVVSQWDFFYIQRPMMLIATVFLFLAVREFTRSTK